VEDLAEGVHYLQIQAVQVDLVVEKVVAVVHLLVQLQVLLVALVVAVELVFNHRNQEILEHTDTDIQVHII
jgi:hypothetical protein